MKTLAPILISLLVISACSEKTDWIEVPLEEDTYYSQEQPFNVENYSIPLKPEEDLEFKLGMKQGDSIVYHWQVEMELPALLTAEFHGHTERVGEEPGTVMFYKRHNKGVENGTLVAPFDGIHGWYFRNDSGQDIVVELSVAGYFNEIPEK